MLNETKKDLTYQARKLVKPYEYYSIDELADAYCEAVDNKDETLKDIYISALILRFWYTIDKMYNLKDNLLKVYEAIKKEYNSIEIIE